MGGSSRDRGENSRAVHDGAGHSTEPCAALSLTSLHAGILRGTHVARTVRSVSTSFRVVAGWGSRQWVSPELWVGSLPVSSVTLDIPHPTWGSASPSGTRAHKSASSRKDCLK